MDRLSVYRELADRYDHLGQVSMRDRFLILAADAALEGGRAGEAETLRQRLLQGSRHHMLRPYYSFAEAACAADVQSYLHDLRTNYPLEVAQQLLDSLKEGVAVFATDGRLKLFNSAVLQIWRLQRSTLNEGPHIDKIIAQCSSLYDDMATWARISRAVTGISDRRQPVAGQMMRPDQSVIDFAVAPLPDGATLITFVDVPGEGVETAAVTVVEPAERHVIPPGDPESGC